MYLKFSLVDGSASILMIIIYSCSTCKIKHSVFDKNFKTHELIAGLSIAFDKKFQKTRVVRRFEHCIR